MKFYILILLFLVSFNLTAQTKNKLSFEFGLGQNTYAMETLNTYYIDSFSTPYKLLDQKIEQGQNYFLNIKYQPMSIFDIGVYGQYQFGEAKKDIEIEFKDGFGDVIEQHKGYIILKSEALSFGLNSNFFLSSLFKFHEKESQLLQHLKLAIEYNAGVGFSKVITQTLYSTYKPASYYDFFTSMDFQSQAAFKVEYDITQHPIITSFGVKFGYQYYRTKIVKDSYGNNWNVLNKYPIELDFSGLFGGVYIGIGK